MNSGARRVVLASSNRGKLAELQALIGNRLQLVTQAELGVPDADESGLSFVENAILKARNAARHTGLPAIADDSGLAVDCLGGRPGIRSSRYAGDDASDADNNHLLLANLEGVPEAARSASFHCVAVMMRTERDPAPLIAQGTWQGRILEAPRGSNGFGYDPLFYVPALGCTAAELPAEVKNGVSHRASALNALLALLP